MRLWAGNVVFLEAAEGLRSALRLLGVAARVDVGVEACPWVSDDELWVLVGATLLPGVAPSDAPWPPPRRFVVYQMEQLGSAWLTPAYLALVARADALWEFAPSPRPLGGARGVAYVPLAPPDLGPAPPPSPAPAADLLFYGCGNARRAALRDACAALLAPRGYRVDFRGRKRVIQVRFNVDFRLGFDLFGAARDDAARRATVVLNAHFDEGAALETHRLTGRGGVRARPPRTATSTRSTRAACASRPTATSARGPRAPRGRRRGARRRRRGAAAELPASAAWADVALKDLG
ncbi:hypothetical protein JL720_5183 [Aureococcus anophagefferens]|nr:hypothetical protein JL720_5183 [Aureococcus anophagefferens]